MLARSGSSSRIRDRETDHRVFRDQRRGRGFYRGARENGSIQLADLSVQEKYVLGLIRQSADYSPEVLWDVWRAHLATQRSQPNGSITVAELCKVFYNRQIQEKRSYRTIADDRWRFEPIRKSRR